MLDVLLQILSVLGIVLLVLLGLLLLVILLVLFFPITYRAEGTKTPEELSVRVKANWLFGLLRLRYAYPEPGRVTVKLLFFKLFETGEDTEKEADKKKKDKKTEDKKAKDKKAKDKKRKDKKKDKKAKDRKTEDGKKTDGKTEEAERTAGNQAPDRTVTEQSGAPNTADTARAASQQSAEPPKEEAPEEPQNGFFKKIEKIKYTIVDTYDKIKQIWQNISYYAELLREEETRLLFSHAKLRIFKILKSIRPRKLKADVLFGTGSPDTTGYAFGVYAALSPMLGPHVAVTPDFERAVLQGEFEAAGHVMAAVGLWHLLRVAVDRRLWRLLDKLKGNAQDKRGNGGKDGR